MQNSQEYEMDAAILNFIQNNFHNPVTDFIFPIITALGNGSGIWLAIAVCIISTKKYRRWGVVLLLAIILTFITGELLLKPLIARPRPFTLHPYTLLIKPPFGFSCPSGHAGSSFSSATVLWHVKRKWGVAALILSVLIAFSRMFLFVHFPSDVLAGALLGFGIATLTCRICKKYKFVSDNRV
jgi:undecaprenyl-diphosphatase